jgi:CubicO group peptidase (beta-lactamase class C family)
MSVASSGSIAGTAAPAAVDSARMTRVLAGLRGPIEVVGRAPVRWTLAERMARYNVPGVSVAVIENGRVAWARGVGLKEKGGTDSVTPATLFQAASISKPVTVTGMLRLVERGTLDLDADVNRYLAAWKVPEGPHTATEKVTLRRIVSHNAGLTVHGFPGYATTVAMPTVAQVLDGAAPANTRPVRVDTTPGAITRYSGGGTTVMQQLLVDVSGKPFPVLMRELVLGPARMTQSTFEQPLPASRAGDAAHAHDRTGALVPGGFHVYPEMAAAGLWTTPSDLATWLVALADARAGRSTALLSRAMATQMLTEQRKGGGFGLGAAVRGEGRAFMFGHNGANAGFHAQAMLFPELGVGAVVMTNGDGGPPLMRELVASIAAEYGWPDFVPRQLAVVALDSARIAGIAGAWLLQVGPGIRAEVKHAGARIAFTAPQLPPDAELLAESDTTFVLAPLAWRVRFSRDASGRATAIKVLRGDGPPIDGARAP